MGLADLHMHTIYSYDGTATVRAVLKRARQVGLDVIAITDHDEIRGALLAEQIAPQYGLEVIPGIEISTAEGDLLALNVHKLIPAGLSLIETLLRIGEQGGYAIAPHPMASGMGMKSLNFYSIRTAARHPEAGKILLGIETYNATAIDRESRMFAEVLAVRTGIARTASSDAHALEAIGLGATEFPGNTAADFERALREGTTLPRHQPAWSFAHVATNWVWNYLLSVPARLVPAMQS
ncbi:MAG: PHP domain-containing protein [Anaerolineales bacterium]|nr:PHP domain-containing protein [Anaerolineales bacterium]MCX7756507.1 PHP domain-containing protein [Anaerolineales bacterium]MDW8278648.1 PHP domain-containing protein [Anaerolineales bacterium]